MTRRTIAILAVLVAAALMHALALWLTSMLNEHFGAFAVGWVTGFLTLGLVFVLDRETTKGGAQ